MPQTRSTSNGDVPLLGGHDPRGDRGATEPQREAESDDLVPQPQVVLASKLDGLEALDIDLYDGEVFAGVGSYDPTLSAAVVQTLVRENDLDIRRSFDDVVVGHDESGLVDDHPGSLRSLFVPTERLTEADDLHVHDGGQGPVHDLRDARALDRIRALLESDLVAALNRTLTITVRPGHAYRAPAQDQARGPEAGRAVSISCFHYVSGWDFEGIDVELSSTDASEGEDH